MRRPFLAPEVTQISSIDCGVAAMVCFLRGCGARVNYERLREACQTDVDGTSIDTLEDVAKHMGVDCVQHLLPLDSFLAEARLRLPIIAVVTTPSGSPHFIVLWRALGARWQIMDPARGRRWMSEGELRSQLHVHTQKFEPTELRAWARQSSFASALRRRVHELVGRRLADALWARAEQDQSWHSLAALDAATRFSAAMKQESARPTKAWTAELLQRSFSQALLEIEAPREIPAEFWSIRPTPSNSAVTMAGCVMLGSQPARPPVADPSRTRLEDAAYLQRALAEPEPSLLKLVRPLLATSPGLIVLAACAIAFASVFVALVEVLTMRIALSEVAQFTQFAQKLGIVGWLASLFLLLLALETVLALGQRRIGRTVETRLRLALFGALPSLDDNFIRSRPTSDLAQRAQLLHLVRDIPALGLTLVRGSADLICTLAIIALLDPWLTVLVGAAAVVLSVTSVVAGKRSAEIELKLQANSAALLHVFQDALLGVIPLRVHGAELSLRREHHSRLLPWVSTQKERLTQRALSSTIQGILVAALLSLILLRGQSVFPDGTRFVLLLFWVLRVPTAAQSLIGVVQMFPSYRLALVRALEPVRGIPERAVPKQAEHTIYGTGHRGVRLRFDAVEVVAAGHVVLRELSLDIAPGEHVAIIGRSGAGKSTLLSLLLGLRAPSRGAIYADDKLLMGETLHALRRQTAWIDPSVQLWNEAFLANLMYGHEEVHRSMNSVLEVADLVGVVGRLPEGLVSRVGSDGTLLSGGEGQRLRVGRALLNERSRLALLDEPFRGLDRDLRSKMLQDLRDVFCQETLILVTHDVEHVVGLDRVLVVEDGRIVEDGAPNELLAHESRFRELYESDLRNKETVWNDDDWIRVEVTAGQATVHDMPTLLEDEEPSPVSEAP